eukprot:m.349302 g.349302  ORF g.349302 m.349302 type:complete len:74 (-) comp55879_c0_seq12:57-278(-)
MAFALSQTRRRVVRMNQVRAASAAAILAVVHEMGHSGCRSQASFCSRIVFLCFTNSTTTTIATTSLVASVFVF